jgi:hypothetical protein
LVDLTELAPRAPALGFDPVPSGGLETTIGVLSRRLTGYRTASTDVCRQRFGSWSAAAPR